MRDLEEPEPHVQLELFAWQGLHAASYYEVSLTFQ